MEYPRVTFKPMLAATCEDLDTINYPVMVSPKLDGYRCIVRDGVAVSRNLKPIPNEFVQTMLKGVPEGYDGELIIGEPVGNDVWNRSAGVMKKGTQPDFIFWVFDRDPSHMRKDAPTDFNARWESIEEVNDRVYRVHHVLCRNADDVRALENIYVEKGFEGIMLRDPNGRYKYGRSTMRDQGLMKFKRWVDTEAEIIGVVEQMHNGNEATLDALGHTKRSTAKAGKTGKGTMGALLVRFDAHAGTPLRDVKPVTFELGTGYDDALRRAVWAEPDEYIGRRVTFKYFGLGADGAPRFPVFLRFRDVDE